jgi:hypothetical protein
MKICARCGKTYPDDEQFCESDGTALVSSAGAARTAPMPPPAEGEPAEGEPATTVCPACGGRAEPGEIICNYCGTRLAPDAAAAPAASGATIYSGPAPADRPGTRRVADPSQFTPRQDRDAEFTGDPGYAAQNWDESPDAPAERSGVMGAIGYIIAAVVALILGAGLAIYLSMRHEAPPPVAMASPSPSPGVAAAPSGPLVALASNMPIQVKSPDLAAALQRYLQIGAGRRLLLA